MKHLSKSDYLKFRIHPAYLWYQKHKPRILPPITDNDQYIFDQGFEFEAITERLFANATVVEGAHYEFDKLTSEAKKAIESGAKTILQGGFMTQDRLFCRSDVLERTENGWILSEIKSSTSVKQTHLYDLAFQRQVLTSLGMDIIGLRVLHVNRYYKRKREEIDPVKFVAIRDVTEEVMALEAEVKRDVAEAQGIIELAQIDDHPVYANNLPMWLPIYRHIHKDLPEDSILNLAQLKPRLLREEYHKGNETITGITSTTLTEKQLIQVKAWKSDEPLVDEQGIAKFLDSLKFPLYFLDYETSGHLTPLFKDTRPYQQVPFQYSLHRLDTPTAELEHFEFLHRELSLPVQPLAAQLISEIGEHGTVLAWFDKFEKYCNRTMGELVPEFETPLKLINKRMTDLRIPFANFSYVDKRFNGSTSIKNVLPVLIPKLSYKSLGIQEGGAAQRLWQQVMDGSRSREKDQIFSDLLEYCKLDTLAMVEIYRFLVEQTDGQTNTSVQSSLF